MKFENTDAAPTTRAHMTEGQLQEERRKILAKTAADQKPADTKPAATAEKPAAK